VALRRFGMIAATIGLLVPSIAAGDHQAVGIGDYTALPKTGQGEPYQPGIWRVVKHNGKTKMVSTKKNSGVYFPAAGKCANGNSKLKAKSIPVSQSGRFSIVDTRAIPDGSGTSEFVVTWKGRWTSKDDVQGTIRLAFKNCSDERSWTGHRSPLAP
jgi:hypothetical protein